MKSRYLVRPAVLGIFATLLMSTPDILSAEKMLVYFGTYTGNESKGVYVTRMDAETGQLDEPKLAAETISPSFLAIHPNGKYLYAANEISNFGGKSAGAITAFSIDRKTGMLTVINQKSSVGAGPCHLVVDKKGNNVLVANYGGGSVSVNPIQKDGALGDSSAFIQHEGSSVNKGRQNEPHAHSINLDADNKYAFAADLGLDRVLIYKFDSKRGSLTQNEFPFASVKPGAGPRHFAFNPKGRFAYVINELSSTVTAFSYDPKHGSLTEIHTLSTLPADFKGNNSTAEVQVHPSGKFVFGSNRGHNSIAVFSVNSKNGMLTYVENELTQGKTPRNFGVEPNGKFLLAANQESHSVVVFRINPKTGELDPAGQTLKVPTPVCVKFLKL